MEKPMTLVIKETKQSIINVVNESGLPPFVLEMIFKDLNTEVESVAKQQAEYEKTEYEKSLQEEQSKTVECVE